MSEERKAESLASLPQVEIDPSYRLPCGHCGEISYYHCKTGYDKNRGYYIDGVSLPTVCLHCGGFVEDLKSSTIAGYYFCPNCKDVVNLDASHTTVIKRKGEEMIKFGFPAVSECKCGEFHKVEYSAAFEASSFADEGD